MSLLEQHLPALKEIAASLEPEYLNWSYGQHNWCREASEAVAEYLNQQNIKAYALRSKQKDQFHAFGWEAQAHTWVELEDGTIIDPTVKQYFLADGEDGPALDANCFPDQNSFWILNKGDSRREYYLYQDARGQIIGSGLETSFSQINDKETLLVF